jgi:hypothetical protein
MSGAEVRKGPLPRAALYHASMQGMQQPDLVPKTAIFGRQGENAEEEMTKPSYK